MNTTEFSKIIITILLSLTVFFLAISISIKSIFILLSMLAISIYNYPELKRILMLKWFWTSAILFMLIVAGCFIDHGSWSTKFNYIHKYSKVLYLPILAIGFRDQINRQCAGHAFLLAMLITCCLSLAKFWGIFEAIGAPGEAGYIFHNRIITGYYMAFAAFLAAIYAGKHETTWKRVGYGLLIILFSYQVLFVNIARTGYLMFGILLCLFIAHEMHKKLNYGWVLLLGFFLALIVFGPARQNINYLVRDLVQYKIGEQDTHLGVRLQLHTYAAQLFLRHPVVGIGTGGFEYNFKIAPPIPNWEKAFIEPHSEYWLMLADHGIIGLGLLILFLSTVLNTILVTKEMRLICLGVMITFAVGCYSDSLLLCSPGFFLILFSSMGLGEALERT